MDARSFAVPLAGARKSARFILPGQLIPLARVVVAGLLFAGLLASGRADAQSSTPREQTWVTDGPVYAIARTTDTIYIGGDFTYVGPNTAGGAALDASSGHVVPPYARVDGRVYTCVPDGATNVPINTALSWSNGGGAASYLVYFGTNLTTGSAKGEQTVTTYSPGALSYSTPYYWRIDAKNSVATTTGTVWHFTTVSAPSSLTLTISGTIKTPEGAALPSVVVSGNNGAASTTTNASGYYELEAPDDWSGRVTPSRAGFTFTPEYRVYRAVTENQTDQDYVGEATVPGEIWKGYTVLYKKDGVPTSPTLTDTGILIVNGGTRDTLQIKKIRGQVQEPIGFVRSDGSFTKFYTEGIIGEVRGGGAVKSLTASGCYVGDLATSSVGTIKMIYGGEDEVFASISSDSDLGLRANISLNGVILQRLSTPAQDVASIKVFAKKHSVKTEDGKYSYVSAARIAGGGGEKGEEVVVARSIGRLATSGGEIIPEAIEAALSSVSARGIVFSLVDAGEKSREEHPGDVVVAFLRNAGPNLTLTSIGGDVAIDELVADGKITKISSTYIKYFDAGEAQFMGGHLGTGGAPSSMLVAAGVNKDMVADIRQIYGALGVSGVFMAGVNFTAMPEDKDDITTPTYRGSILNINSKIPSTRLPEDPVIEGEAFVLDRTKLQTKLDKLTNVADFKVYDKLHPKP